MQTKDEILTSRQGRPAVTIAVFPFENLTEGNREAIFCASFSMDLITELSKFPQFQIISLQSLQDISPDTESFAQLETDYHIGGSFRSGAGKIRVNAQLVDSHSLRMVWGNRFEAPLEAMLDMQEELLQEVLATLQSRLNYDLLSRFRKKGHTSLKAYEYYLCGQEELKKGTTESDEQAREYFRQAIALDPDYSMAYSGISLSWFNEWSCQLWERWEVNQNGAFEWAEKAIEIDEHNYLAAAVLGRIFLYKEAFETAEHYVRHSLKLNNNDPFTLIMNATSLTYLGKAGEAWEWYNKAQRINPANARNYFHIGAFILLMQEKYKEAAELFEKAPPSSWIDEDVFRAVISFNLGEMNKMKKYWENFIRLYKAKISKTHNPDESDVIAWVMTINPFHGVNPFDAFFEHLGKPVVMDHASEEVGTEDPSEGSFLKNGNLWTLTYDGKEVTLPEVKGFYDLQKMLVRPQEPFHCAELMNAGLKASGVTVLDEKAKKTYQQKIMSLQEDISDAETMKDYEKAERLQREYDEILEHLSSALGLGGKSRKQGGSVEKARSAVTWRIRSAISRIEKEHPRLGKHLSNSIRTGTTCSYHPEQPVHWST